MNQALPWLLKAGGSIATTGAQREHKMDIRIVDVEWALDDAGATYQAYVVEIARGLKTWAVRRRYSAFDDLRRAVSKELGPLASPFPGKNLFGRADPAKRQRELEAWLRELALAVAPAREGADCGSGEVGLAN